jgi:hypothetical protein
MTVYFKDIQTYEIFGKYAISLLRKNAGIGKFSRFVGRNEKLKGNNE